MDNYYGYSQYSMDGGDLKETIMKPIPLGPLGNVPLVALIGAGVGLLVLIIIIAVVVSKAKKKKNAALAALPENQGPPSRAIPSAPASAPAKPEPPANQAGQEQPQAIAPKPPVEQTPQVTYTFHPGMDSGGNDIHNKGNLANNVAGLKAHCTSLPNCKAFNTNGWIKHTVRPKAQWYKWTSEPNKGMYTRN